MRPRAIISASPVSKEEGGYFCVHPRSFLIFFQFTAEIRGASECELAGQILGTCQVNVTCEWEESKCRTM